MRKSALFMPSRSRRPRPTSLFSIESFIHVGPNIQSSAKNGKTFHIVSEPRNVLYYLHNLQGRSLLEGSLGENLPDITTGDKKLGVTVVIVLGSLAAGLNRLGSRSASASQ